MAANTNLQLLERYFQAFREGNAEEMAKCYHMEAQFEDPAFGKLARQEIGQMWRMLLERAGGNLRIEYSGLEADENRGSAHWEARYPFGRAGRKVHNKVNSTFEFKNGLIYRQHDRFSMWRWAAMALGLPGLLLGFTPMLRKKVQGQSRAMLRKYVEGRR